MGTVPQGSTTVGALSESVGGQLSESVGVCRSCRRTIVGALSDCRNRAQNRYSSYLDRGALMPRHTSYFDQRIFGTGHAYAVLQASFFPRWPCL